jgi:hypothetical protein
VKLRTRILFYSDNYVEAGCCIMSYSIPSSDFKIVLLGPLIDLLYQPWMMSMGHLLQWEFSEEREVLGETYPYAIFSTTNPTWRDLGWNIGRCNGKSATNLLSYKRLVAGFPPLRSRIRNRTWSCGICDGTKWCWGMFSSSSSVSPAIVVRSTNYSTITMYHPGNAQ